MAEETQTEVAEAPPPAPDAPPRAEAVTALEERFARGLDKVAPLPKPKAQAATPSEEAPPAPPPEELPPPKPKEPKTKTKPKVAEPSAQILPTFLQKKPVEEVAPPAPTEAEPPEELPGLKDERSKSNWKNFRERYKARGNKISEVTARLSELEAQVGKDTPATLERMKQLEEQNQQLLGITERVALESSPRFQAQNRQPRAAALDYAKGIVRDAGGNPADLEKAVALSGPAHYAALEEVFQGLPEVAKGEITAVIKDIRLYDRQRDLALADPKRSLEAIRKEDLLYQQRQLQEQERETDNLLERVLVRMREHNKVEVLQRSTDPKDKWWNDQVDQIEATARQLSKTHDPEQLMAALAMAPMTDAYRKLFLDSQDRIAQLEKRVAQFESHEPSLDGEGTEVSSTERQKKELAKPLGQAFRDILMRNRRQ